MGDYRVYNARIGNVVPLLLPSERLPVQGTMPPALLQPSTGAFDAHQPHDPGGENPATLQGDVTPNSQAARGC